MNSIYFCFFILLLSSITSCGHKKNKSLAQNYYELSSIELEGEQSGSSQKALQYIEQAIAQENKPEYHARRATLLFKLGKYEKSLACFKQLLHQNLNPYLKTEVLNNYGCLLGQMGKHEEALKIFEKLERSKNYLTPEVALVNQGKLQCEQGDHKTAKEKFLKAAQIAPNYVDAHYYLTVVSSLLEDHKQFERELETTLFLEPGHQGAQLLKTRLQR